MNKGVRLTLDRRPTLPFMREWQAAMAAKKAADPTLSTIQLPYWLEIVDREGRPNPQMLLLSRLFDPPLQRAQKLVDGQGYPTPYALQWWGEAT